MSALPFEKALRQREADRGLICQMAAMIVAQRKEGVPEAITLARTIVAEYDKPI